MMRRAVEYGVTLSIGPDAHHADGLADMECGMGIARKGWLTAADVLNCGSADDVESFCRRRRGDWKPSAGLRSRWNEPGALAGKEIA